MRPNGIIEAWGSPIYDDVLSGLPAAGTWVKIEAGWYEAIALLSNGTVYVWGYHFPYQCDEPVLGDCEDCLFSDVAAGENIMVDIVAGGPHDGDLFVWGKVDCFDPDSLSDGGYIDSGASPFVTVSVAGHHILAMKASGDLVGFGSPPGDHTHFGCEYCCEYIEMFNPSQFPPPSHQTWWGTPPDMEDILLFSAGHGHSLIWADTSALIGSLYGWGKNSYGQTGVVTTEEQVDTVPKCGTGYQKNITDVNQPNRTDVENLAFPSDPVKIEGAKTFSTVMFADGTLLCWGDDSAAHDYPSTLPTVGDGTYLDFSARHHHGAAISTCYADCDGDGQVNMLDYGQDYTCFLLLWQANDIAADCNQDNAFTADDLYCFYLLYQSGCE